MTKNSVTESSIKRGRVSAGMSFDQKVWAVTSRIPRGKVATYAWVARQLRSNGYRAVGGALNRNPYAPGVPCHRVVGSNGSLTGFAHGLKAKQEILQREGVEIIGGRVDLGRFGV
jgi:methylated-DNA-[protein]-cysteine S-methyltransferase